MELYDELLRERYGTPDGLLAERYGKLPAPRKPRRKQPAAKRLPTREQFHVTSDARVRCDCGVFVYTVVEGDGPAHFPAVCWRCGQPIGDELGHTRPVGEQGSA